MDSSPTPHLCETCGLPYVVNESCGNHMSPPDDYGRGFSRYCLACWLGVGLLDDPDLFGSAAQPARSRNANADHASGAEIPLNRSQAKKEPRGESDPLRMPQRPSVYLWLCCEGWMRFGPFEWLRIDDKTATISDSNGKVIAIKQGAHWFVPAGRGSNTPFDDLMITTRPVHPHNNSGANPGRIR